MFNKNFYYDPARQGYDTSLWRTLTGTPSVASDKIVLNSTSIIHYADLFKGDLTMRLMIPTAPATGDSRFFGFGQKNVGASLGFLIKDEFLLLLSTNEKGESTSKVVAWDPIWTNAETDFTIRWRGTYADFLINGKELVVPIDQNDTKARINDTSVPKIPLSVYISNDNADDLLLLAVNVTNIQTIE